MGRQHSAAALCIQRVFRGHVGRTEMRQLIVDLYKMYDYEEGTAEAEWEEQPVVTLQGGLATDESGALSPRE